MRVDTLSTPQWKRVSELIATRTGLNFPPERHADLRRALEEAAPEFNCEDGAACAEWLLSAALSVDELRKLATHLTIGETYFFRERPSFNALATHVMPALIHRARAGNRRLRLWSAACSSGEEAYSLAILIQQVLPDWRDWNISILATDINPQALRKARAGVYGEWSFRESSADFRARYFSKTGKQQYRVHDDVRELVTFAELNLSQDTFPSIATDTNAMDLILCRNLLIYFTPAHARRLVTGLHRSLVDEGWLIVSPSECSQALFTGFVPVNFPGSILYRKRGAHETPEPRGDWNLAAVGVHVDAPATTVAFSTPQLPVGSIAALPPVAPAGIPDTNDATLEAARTHYTQGDYRGAVALLRGALAASLDAAPDTRLLGMLAHALANLGDLDAALTSSEQWIAANKLDAAAHYLNAMVLQELGEHSSSRAALQRAVYLLPEFTLAHFALGNNARAEARHAEAQRHFANAAHLLRASATDEPVAESEGLTAGRLREIIAALTAVGAQA